MTIKAIYRDEADNIFSGIVVRTTDGWRIQTDEHGPRKIEYYFEEKSAEGGYIQFVDYEISPEQRLRPADVIPYINSVRATLPFPQRPADLPPIQSEPEDSRLHVSSLPGESPLAALQRAYAEQVVGPARKAEQHARQQFQETFSHHDPRQVAQARRNNNLAAARIRPKRGN